jgi:hypothetical protein
MSDDSTEELKQKEARLKAEAGADRPWIGRETIVPADSRQIVAVDDPSFGDE